MKYLFITLITLLPGLGFGQDNSYTIDGTFPARHVRLFLRYNKGNRTYISDTAEVIDGKFRFKGTIDAPYEVTLTATYMDIKGHDYNDELAFFLDAGVTRIDTRDSLRNATVTGTQLCLDATEYKKSTDALTAEFTTLFNDLDKATPEAEKTTSVYQKKMEVLEDSFTLRQKSIDIAFIRSHPESRLDLYIFREETYGYTYNELVPLFEGLSPSIRNSSGGKQYADRLEKLKAVALGQTAPDFTQPDTSGKTVRLSSFRGKYVLVDFWASWCGPCRGESPYLVAAFDKYKGRNFTIIGVSLDKKPQRRQWLQAIAHDKLYWTQVSDLSDTNPVVVLYGVKGIPQNFLIDPEGKIIAHNLRGDMLEQKLSEVLK